MNFITWEVLENGTLPPRKDRRRKE